jgi:branched-chain amino acid transport system permease protein
MDFVEVLASSLRATLGPAAAAFAIATLGLNVQYGYTGLLNFGHVAFLMTGAYGTAITVDQGGSLWLGIAVGLGASVVLALIFGLPTLRLRADYLAIVTIAGGEVLRVMIRSGGEDSLTRGVFGIQGFADEFFDLNPIADGRYGWGRFSFSERSLWVLIVGWVLFAILAALVARLVRSPWGRVLRSIREDEDAASALGKNVFAYKLQSLALGGGIGAVAGILLAIERQSVNPDSYLPVGTFTAYALLILGGAGTRLGPLVGSLTYWFVIEFTDSMLRQGQSHGWIPTSVIDTTDLGAVRFMLVGLALMLLAAFRPQGLLGNREEVLLDA